MISLKINGQDHQVDVDPATPLLWVLRDTIGLTGTKYGCGIAACGACTVHMDGQPTRSCSVTVGDVGAASITTIEAVESKAAKAVQTAWQKLDVVQCGYCQSGQIMAATAPAFRKARRLGWMALMGSASFFRINMAQPSMMRAASLTAVRMR